MNPRKKSKSSHKTRKYREIIERLKSLILSGRSYDNFSDGNSMGFSVTDPFKVHAVFERFEKLKKE